jgi:hypothetical protein
MKSFGKPTFRLALFIGVAILAAAAENAAMLQLHALDQQEKTDLQNLNEQMEDLKAKHQTDTTQLQQQLASFNSAYDSTMKQLREQYDETRNRDGEERATIMDRIKPGYLALYNQRRASTAGVNGQEEQSVQSLRRQEDAELQSIRDRYNAEIKNSQQQATGQRQAIDSQFDAAVKGLK